MFLFSKSVEVRKTSSNLTANKLGIIISTVIVLLITAFVFTNSLENRDESIKSSNKVLEFLKPFLRLFVDVENIDVSKLVRKIAHFVEYFLLAIGVSGLVYFIYKSRCVRVYGVALFYVLLIAVLDETVQLFVGRFSSLLDVILDFFASLIGFLFSIVLLMLLSKVKRSLNEKRRNSNI